MTNEQAEVLGWFHEMLRTVTADGGRKRAAGTKPLWKVDSGHPSALYRHLEAWEIGERYDPDNGAHPLVAVAWRALAIAAQETGVV